MHAKIIFFGTHDFGAAMLSALIKNKNYDIVAVVTQPDRQAGRKHEISKSPVKILAEQHGLNILQPESLKNLELGTKNWDLSVVCQYGLIIPKIILELPKFGFINIHTSLLPKYRGASPIQTAIVNGETETGITIMLMDEKMDHGQILSQAKIQISADETYLNLQKRMEPAAEELLIKTLPEYLNGKITPTAQTENEATFCKIFSRDDGRIDWKKTSVEIYNQYRGLSPWPGVWTMWNGKRLKLLEIKISNLRIPAGETKINDRRIFVGTKNGAIEILSLQLEGKKGQTAANFISGQPLFESTSLT